MTDFSDKLKIIDYKEQYVKCFYDINNEWTKTYFFMEPCNEKVLSKPDKYIIKKGGCIFFSKLNKLVVGTVALIPANGVFELSKMAVLPNYRGYKIGQKLMQHCIAFAKQKGISKLILYSNTVLKNVIYIYKKYGFIEIPVEDNST